VQNDGYVYGLESLKHQLWDNQLYYIHPRCSNSSVLFRI